MTAPQLTSPWIHQLNRKRPLLSINHDLESDVAIVGAGIAGTMTAYFLLKNTNKGVLLLDGGRVAHGATGHNAGQLVSYFERPLYDIADEYGLEMAAEGQKDVESSWELLEQVIKREKIETPCHLFTGYAGCVDLGELLHHLKNNVCRKQAGLPTETIFVSKTFKDRKLIPASYRSLYTLVSQSEILDKLQTKDTSYTSLLAGKKGCMNSAAFCEELVGKMLEKYPERFQLVENLPIEVVQLRDKDAVLKSKRYRVSAKRVVLCTNGFERLTIKNEGRPDIDGRFHHLVKGSVGYMAAFVEEASLAPTAISYLPARGERENGAYDNEPYYYLTRRPYDIYRGKQRNLICIGGPEVLMDDTNHYHVEHSYPKEARLSITRFLRRVYPLVKKRLTYAFFWHGLMGYTPNGVRCVGVEPCNAVLLYNLGCNGVGILPSIFGGHRIARLIKGEKLPPSIFDPQDRRCALPLPSQAYSWRSLFKIEKSLPSFVKALSILLFLCASVLAISLR